jgi:hypothetical protein
VSDFSSIEELKRSGFEGFVSVRELNGGALVEVPTVAGVYCVVHKFDARPEFLTISKGGQFKGKDPTVSIPELKYNWVDGSSILYFGKAGGPNSKAHLQKRIKSYLRFGNGEPVSHYGGRLIWQIVETDQLMFCWRDEKFPRDVERELIADFLDQFGKRPFANLVG